MRALGFDWHQQTVATVEKGKRRITAEELLFLSYALRTTVAALASPAENGFVLQAPSGAYVAIASVQRSVAGQRDDAIRWDGNEPVFAEAALEQLAAEGLVSRAQVSSSTGAVRHQNPKTGTWELPIAAAIVTSGKRVLIGKRNDRTPPWTFIAGENEPGEGPADTITRETKEETGLEIRAGEKIGERDHPATGRHMIYLAGHPVRGTKTIVGDEAELAEVRWVGLAEAVELLPGMYGPVREYLERQIGGQDDEPA